MSPADPGSPRPRLTQETDVIIAGAGPAGLFLASELRLHGVAVVLLERHRERPGFSRGFNLNARALDLLARRGLADRFIDKGHTVPQAPFSVPSVTLGLAGTRTDHPFSLGIPQTRVEELLEAHALDLGTDLRRGHDLVDVDPDDDGVTVSVATSTGTTTVRGAFLVGCDGGRSTVRRKAHIDFPGTDATQFTLLGDVELADPTALAFGPNPGANGTVLAIPRPGYVRLLTADPQPPGDPHEPVTLALLQARVDQALGHHVELRNPRWLTRFGNAARLAARYVSRRVLLAGDAAHIHPPAGAIGVNVALDDAFNLGWKLAAAVQRRAPTHLLDSYHDERHTAGRHVLASTCAQTLLGSGRNDLAPLIDLINRVASHPAGNTALAEIVTGLDTRYEMHPTSEHPDVGCLFPDHSVRTATGPTTVARLLEAGRGLLLDLTDDPVLRAGAAPWSPDIDAVIGACPTRPDLTAVLLRPDGHTAWLRTTHEPATHTPTTALEHWFGTAPPDPNAPPH